MNGRPRAMPDDSHAVSPAALPPTELLGDSLQGAISHVKHEINNPLAIISGNAQLLMELVRAFSLGDDMLKPVQDIEEASRRIASSLDKLDQLKQYVSREHGQDRA